MNRHAAEQNAVFWRKNARRYDRATLVLNRRFSEMAALVAEDLRGADRVLEVAAGTGLVTVRLATAVTSLIATDRSPQMLEVLSGRLKQERVANVDVRIADAASLEFPDHTFDAVVAANLLHLVDAPTRVLAEAPARTPTSSRPACSRGSRP